ncbi:hypothetical protein [Pseudomonas syringae]|uniref:hypothetical protein n=1 Tax=Pseudomonas syringae TaxID=317 RepID=UPI001BCDB6A9|nr:hypothetical protein [Pseudomonas syringae]MBS7412510.1 hypothetical protein [Pseudomonas syringae]
MDRKKLHHQKVVAGFIKNKLQEYSYFLDKVMVMCDKAARQHYSYSAPSVGDNRALSYLFNALTNTVQSLKDSLETATGAKIAWSRFSSVRHFLFFKESRNAMTHDGMQIIDGYKEGKFYMAASMQRIDNHGNTISIDAPSADVLTFCKQFTSDFMAVLDEIIDEREPEFPKTSLKENLQFAERTLGNGFIPDKFRDLGRNMFSEVFEQVPAELLAAEFGPVKDIKKEIASIRAQCQGGQLSMGSH